MLESYKWMDGLGWDGIGNLRRHCFVRAPLCGANKITQGIFGTSAASMREGYNDEQKLKILKSEETV